MYLNNVRDLSRLIGKKRPFRVFEYKCMLEYIDRHSQWEQLSLRGKIDDLFYSFGNCKALDYVIAYLEENNENYN